MGSGKTRKKGDNPIIRRPKFSTAIESIDNVLDVGGATSEICKPSFEVIVRESYLTKPGVKVRLEKMEEVYFIKIAGSTIGRLNKKLSKMVSECGELGVKYSGEIIKKEFAIYARFIRNI